MQNNSLFLGFCSVNIWWYSLWLKFLMEAPIRWILSSFTSTVPLTQKCRLDEQIGPWWQFLQFFKYWQSMHWKLLVGDWRRRRVLGKFTGKLQVIIILGKFCEIVNCTEIFCFQYARNSWCNFTYDKLFSGLQCFLCEKNPLLTFTYTYTITAFE